MHCCIIPPDLQRRKEGEEVIIIEVNLRGTARALQQMGVTHSTCSCLRSSASTKTKCGLGAAAELEPCVAKNKNAATSIVRCYECCELF